METDLRKSISQGEELRKSLEIKLAEKEIMIQGHLKHIENLSSANAQLK